MFLRSTLIALVIMGTVPSILAATVAKVYPVKNFSEFIVGGNAAVEITQDGTEYLRVEADEEIMHRVKVDQTGTRVSIKIKNPNHFFDWFDDSDDPMRVVLRVKNLTYLDLSGATTAHVKPLQSTYFQLHISGAANADLAGLNTVNFKLNGSGASEVNLGPIISENQEFELSGATKVNIKLPSSTRLFEAEVSGASNLYAKQLTTKAAKVNASGASHIELCVTDELTADASGASSIDYHGRPKTDIQSTGASHINSH